MHVFKGLAVVVVGGVLVASPALAQTGSGATPGAPGTSGNVLQPADSNRPPSTNQTTPSTPNTGLGGSVTGGIPGTLGGTPYSIGGSVTGGIPGTLGATPSGGGSSQSNSFIGGAGTSTTPSTPSTIGGSTTGAVGGTSSTLGGGTTGSTGFGAGSIGGGRIGGATGGGR
jgi:hypothetical protein